MNKHMNTMEGRQHPVRDILIIVMQQLVLFAGDDYLFGSSHLRLSMLNGVEMFALFLFVIVTFWIFTVPPSKKAHIFNKHGSIILPFSALMGIAFLSSFYPNADYADNGGRWLYYPLYQLMIFSMPFFVSELRISPRLWRLGMRAGYFVFVGTIFIDVIHPHTFSILAYRAAGLGLNPNTSAEIIVAYLICVLNWKKTSAWDSVFFIVGFAAEFATLSREGFVVYAIVVLAYVFVHRHRMQEVIRVFIPFAFLLIVVASMIPFLTHNVAMLSFNSSRLSAFLGQNSQALLSGNGRFTDAQMGLQTAMGRPIFGYGEGYVATLPHKPHDEFLAIWIEQGIVGLLLFIWFLVSVLRKNILIRNAQGAVMVITMMAYGLFNHNFMDEKPMIMMIVYSTIFPVIPVISHHRSRKLNISTKHGVPAS